MGHKDQPVKGQTDRQTDRDARRDKTCRHIGRKQGALSDTVHHKKDLYQKDKSTKKQKLGLFQTQELGGG